MPRLTRIALLVVVFAGPPAAVSAQPTRDNNLALGNPSGATASTGNSNNFLISKSQYAVSYNRSKATANWVSWHLSTAWLGSADRSASFTADPALPTGWARVYQDTYTGSGFDRGHLCPSADRTGSSTDNAATFTGTNVIPQAPFNNQGPWEKLESYCRSLAGRGNELYVIAGPAGTGGTGTGGYATTVTGPARDGGSMTVGVPASTWKVVVVLPTGSNDVARISSSTRVIAVNMPNDNTKLTRTTGWGGYRTTVREIETLTGYNFLSAVPATVQSAVETRVDTGPTQ